MALPIPGIFLNKVYNDSILGYSQNERFIIPEKYANPCYSSGSESDNSTTISSPGGIDDLFK